MGDDAGVSRSIDLSDVHSVRPLEPCAAHHAELWRFGHAGGQNRGSRLGHGLSRSAWLACRHRTATGRGHVGRVQWNRPFLRYLGQFAEGTPLTLRERREGDFDASREIFRDASRSEETPTSSGLIVGPAARTAVVSAVAMTSANALITRRSIATWMPSNTNFLCRILGPS